MSGDFSRRTFDPTKHYSGVLMQQGRVQLDADWNEQLEIRTYRAEAEALDAIGSCGAPSALAGFEIMADAGLLSVSERHRLADRNIPQRSGDFLIGSGRCYAGGLLCENERTVSFLTQPDLPDAKTPDKAGMYVAYLDVWKHEVNWRDDPRLSEAALGGLDTTTRIRTVWQVKLVPLDDWANRTAPSTGTMNARTKSAGDQQEPCLMPPSAGYQGLENQLYRVEVHAGGGRDQASFKWSRENASVETAILKVEGRVLTVYDTGRDEALGFAPDQWVEVVDRQAELTGSPRVLQEIEKVDTTGRKITLKTAPANVAGRSGLKLRRWDQSGNAATDAGVKMTDGWADLESGIQVQFSQGTYRAGDYWLMPARTATREIEWPPYEVPNQNPVAQPRAGIGHYYCPLALLEFGAAKAGVQLLRIASDCRRLFAPEAREVQVLGVLAASVYGGNPVLHNGVEIPANYLNSGLRVLLNGAIDPARVSRAVCSVAIDLPYPISDPDRKIWGDALIGYQPLVLDAEVKADPAWTLRWLPSDGTRQFLERSLFTAIQHRVVAPFPAAWEVVDQTGSQSSWAYGESNFVVQKSESAGTMCLNRQPLGKDAWNLTLTVAAPEPKLNDPVGIGLIFNWQGPDDYWLFVCNYHAVQAGPQNGFRWHIWLDASTAHMLHGQAQEGDAHEVVYHPNYLRPGLPDVRPAPGIISFNIKRIDKGLLCTPAIQFGTFTPPKELDFQMTLLKRNLLEGSRVGLVTRDTGGARFTRLEVVYPDAAPAVLIPAAGASRVLAHLTVRPGSLGPETIARPYGDPRRPARAAPPEPDFRIWFWLGAPQLHYGYGYGWIGSAGLGSDLL